MAEFLSLTQSSFRVLGRQSCALSYPLMASSDQFEYAEWGSQRPQSERSLRNTPSAIQSYGLAVGSVAVALALALLLQHFHLHRVELSLFLFAIALTAWHAGVRPAALSIVLSILCFTYFFSPPFYSFAFSVADVPAIVILLSFALLIIAFSVVRRRIEEQLLRAHDELQAEVVKRTRQASLLNLTHDAIFVRDMSAVITYWNRGAEEMYGWTAQEACGKITHELLQTAFPTPLEQIKAELKDTGRWQGELVHIRKNGTLMTVASRWSLQQNDQGTPTAILEINNDISEQKRAEQAGQEIEEQWRAAFESNPTMYFIVGSDGTIANVNAFGAEQLGYTVNELVGQPVLNVFYKPDRDAVQKHANECFQRPGQMMRWEARKIRKDGSMLWVRETANAVFLNNRLVLLVICEDITEQKRAEEAARRSEKELRGVIETIPVNVWSALPDGSIDFVNQRTLECTGLSREGILGWEWGSAVHPDDLADFIGKWRRSLADGKGMEIEERVRYVDGTYHWWLIRNVPLRDELGNITKWYGSGTDIEDRKRAEEALRRSEAYLAEAQKLTKTGSWAWDPKTKRVIYGSEEFYRIFGLDPQETPPSDELLERIHPEDREKVSASREKAEHSVEYRLMLPDGTLKYVLGTRRPVFDGAGGLVEVIGTTVDMTERKRAEEALRAAETRFRTFVDHATDALFVDDEEGTIVDVNRRACEILGYTREQLIGASPPDFDLALDVVTRQSVNQRLAAGEIVAFETCYRRKDGTVFPVDLRVRPFWHEGHRFALAVVRDISDRKRAEEELRAAETRFRASVDHLTDALYIHDDQDDHGRVIDVNQQACDSLGYSREELIGMTALDFDAVQDAATMKSVKERLARGEIFCFESAHRRKDGTVFPVEVRVRAFFHGEHRFGLAVVRDITDRKRSQQERERLRQLEADLARINRVTTMGELAASLAHEIKQPIAATVSNAEACLQWLSHDDPDLSEVSEAATEAVHEARRAADIITRVRSLFKKEEITRVVLDINEVIADAVSLIREEADRSSVSVRMTLDRELPKISGDHIQLQQVLMNLMLNGLEAMNGAGGILAISSQRDGDRTLISVSDAGVGLPAGGADKIFDAFFTTKPQGTGMGLAISRSIIEAHGGRLWATANSDRGATFHFTLPNLLAESA